MTTSITFVYDEAARKWDVFARGVTDDVEARQAFYAVLITCMQATPRIDYNKAELQEDSSYKISVGVSQL